MGVSGKLVREVDVKGGCNFLHHIFRHKPNEIAMIAPDKIQRCDLVSGQWGASGSVISLHFIHDGKVSTVKEMIEADDEKVVFNVIEGDVLQVYNMLTITFHFEEMGDNHLGVWSIDFQKVNESIPDPTPYLDLLCAITKDTDAYILKRAAGTDP